MNNTPLVSFEFFPPHDDAGETRLWHVMARLAPLGPAFVSVTYGAGGSTRKRTDRVVRRIHDETNVPVAAHLTCGGASREEVDAIADGWWRAGIHHIVALRGDMPSAEAPYAPHPEGYTNAADLVTGLRDRAGFEISVAAYPECHPDSPTAKADLDNLKRKVDAGATQAITQYFFDNDLPVASVCHGVEIPARADRVRGRRMATVPKCKFDLEVCGGTFVDEPCVVDGNLVSGRTFHDNGRYFGKFIELLDASV